MAFDLKFWKKKEEEPSTPVWNTLDNNPPMGAPPEMPGFGQEQFPQQPSFAPVTEPPLTYPQQPPQMAQSAAPPSLSAKDVELLSAKLDTIRAQLESLNTRIAHLERIAEGSQQKGW